MNDILFNICQVLLVSAVIAVLRYAIPYMTRMLRSHDYNFAADIIETMVRAAEQMFTGHGRGDEKFQYVVRVVGEQLDKYGIKITDEQIAQLIEAAVQAMNAELAIVAAGQEDGSEEP